MAVVLDLSEQGQPSPPPGKGAPAGPACPAQAGLDPGQGAGLAEMGRDEPHRAREQARDRLRGGRLPQYRRVLGEEARHLHDHGRHLHAGLRLLQREDRACRRPLDPRRARERRQRRREARPPARGHHLGRPGRPSGRRRAAFRRGDPRDPRRVARDDHRGPDAGLPAQGTARWRSSSRPARRVQPQPRNGAVEVPEGAARARATSTRSGCCSG